LFIQKNFEVWELKKNLLPNGVCGILGMGGGGGGGGLLGLEF